MGLSIDREKVIKGLEWILEDDRFGFGVNWENGEPRDDHEKAGKIITDTIILLKEQESEILKYIEGVAKLVMENERLKALLKEQEPEIGHWILDPDGMDWNIPAWRCSKCGNRHNGLPTTDCCDETNIYLFAGSRFCPNCGVKMEGSVKMV